VLESINGGSRQGFVQLLLLLLQQEAGDCGRPLLLEIIPNVLARALSNLSVLERIDGSSRQGFVQLLLLLLQEVQANVDSRFCLK
jgi:hypothetical protein